MDECERVNRKYAVEEEELVVVKIIILFNITNHPSSSSCAPFIGKRTGGRGEKLPLIEVNLKSSLA